MTGFASVTSSLCPFLAGPLLAFEFLPFLLATMLWLIPLSSCPRSDSREASKMATWPLLRSCRPHREEEGSGSRSCGLRDCLALLALLMELAFLGMNRFALGLLGLSFAKMVFEFVAY